MSGWFIERDNYPKQCLKMTQGEKYKLGRMPTCDIVCNDVRISKRHCEIYIKKDSSKGFIMDFSVLHYNLTCYLSCKLKYLSKVIFM